jgi:hypothetical protein
MKVLTYSDERDMFAKQGKDGAQAHPLMQTTTMLPTKYSISEVSDKSM